MNLTQEIAHLTIRYLSERSNKNIFCCPQSKAFLSTITKPKPVQPVQKSYTPPPPPEQIKPVFRPTPKPVFVQPEAKSPPAQIKEEKKTEEEKTFFNLDPVLAIHSKEVQELKPLFIEKIGQKWIDNIPNIAKADIAIITDTNDPSEIEFLKKVAKAISDKFVFCELVHIAKVQTTYKLVLSSKDLLTMFPQVPFIEMEKTSVYLTKPESKAQLWRTICDRLCQPNSLQSP